MNRLYIIIHEIGMMPRQKRVPGDDIARMAQLMIDLRRVHPTSVLIAAEVDQFGRLSTTSENEILTADNLV